MNTEKTRDEEVDEIFAESNITCPYCLHVDRDSWEAGDEGDVECECGGTYTFTRNVTVDYTSVPTGRIKE